MPAYSSPLPIWRAIMLTQRWSGSKACVALPLRISTSRVTRSSGLLMRAINRAPLRTEPADETIRGRRRQMYQGS
jgi:hypothetical protein